MALLRALLLATWHDLSDVQLAEALDDRARFRRFCGFAAHAPTPGRTAFVRLRRGLDRVLFAAVTRQLAAQGVSVRTGTWGRPETLARLKAHNAAVQRIRCRIEKVFGTWTRSYTLRRTATLVGAAA